MKEIWVVFGTRPEAIKLTPVIRALRRERWARVVVVSTGQHREMLAQTLGSLDLQPDRDLRLMTEDQDPASVASRILTSVFESMRDKSPAMILVQGDTTTTFAASLAAYYARVPVGHVEAGLRTHDKHRPFPEEINRRVTTCLADLHFAPTQGAREALLEEAVPEDRVFVTGNTVVDILLETASEVERDAAEYARLLPPIPPGRRIVLVTGHRRESFGPPLEQICLALKDLASQHPDLEIIYPVHLNPRVQAPVRRILDGVERIHLLEPMDYKPFVFLMTRCHLVLSDSGGIQEEAPSLGRPVLVMRDKTERPEGLKAGTSRLVGTDRDTIVRETGRVLMHPEEYARMTGIPNPYGDGRASERILAHLRTFLEQ